MIRQVIWIQTIISADAKTELLLYIASRRQMVERVLPALVAGKSFILTAW